MRFWLFGVCAGRHSALRVLLAIGLCAAVVRAEQPTGPEQLEWLTDLAGLRRCAEQQPSVVQPFRIVAEVYDADSTSGVLVLRDNSGVEFICLDVWERGIEPGATVCLEGKGCGVKPKGFGLEIVRGLVVDNDGLHELRLASGKVFLKAGTNPITVQWFNGLGDFSLNVEYEGPGVPRQMISSSVLSRAKTDSVTGVTNFLPGLDYRYYKGGWVRLPDFGKHKPVKTGVATNFDVGVLGAGGPGGVEFSGFITIPQDGIYTFHVNSDDGSRLFVGESCLKIRVLSHGPPPEAAAKIPLTVPERTNRPWVTIEGTVEFAGIRESGGELVARVGSEDIRVKILEGREFASRVVPGNRVRLTGIYQDVVTEDGSQVAGRLLVSSWRAVQPISAPTKSQTVHFGDEEAMDKLPVQTAPHATAIQTITTAAEIKALSAELAKRQLPVSIRGVVTAVLADYLHGAVIQDATKGVFISLENIFDPRPLRVGEFYQIEGVTGSGAFAPSVVAHRITHLGAGVLPRPLRATWDQLRNGSLDTQYAEIEGVVTAVEEQQIKLLTAGGMITLILDDMQPEDLSGYENALVQIRGCAFACFNLQTRELDASMLRIIGGAIGVLEPAPHDLFNASPKSIGELLFYDPKAAPFRLLKVNGQIIHGRAGEYFLTDGTSGMRVTTRNPDGFAIGELVDAVGFLDLGGPIAGFKEAVIRKTGRAPLPHPKKVSPDELLLARHAGTLVQISANLINQWRDGREHVFELQSGLIVFRARVCSRDRSIATPPVGSQLELTGVYAPQGGRTEDGKVTGFELLLHSPAGIRVVATPPWWTLKRVLVLAGILAVLLLAILIWNKELRRQVQERTRRLELEIRNRQKAELLHAAEAERARIARDLHDELGAGLTEVILLANAGLGETQEAQKNQERFQVIAEKARALVSGLDVIVWAIDPRRSSLQAFADYLGRYATELFSTTDIVCRFKIPIECEAVMLSETARHSLVLAVKEALNNVIRHSSATEVKLGMAKVDNSLEIVVADNGRGFDGEKVRRGNGLRNLCERVEALNGHCHIESQPGHGTTVKLVVPLPNGRS